MNPKTTWKTRCKGVQALEITDAKIISWILGSLDTKIGIPMRGFKLVVEMWGYLEEVYQQLNHVIEFQMDYDIFSYSQ